MSTKDPQRVFPPYAANVTKKTAKVTEFMNQNAGDAATLGPRKLDTLAQLMQSLREQLGQMEVALDEQRGANMENKTFERIQKMVDKSVDSGTAVLDRASQFMHEQETARQTRPRAKIQAAVSSTIPFARLRS
jgi:CHASE3 domain sensor protein